MINPISTRYFYRSIGDNTEEIIVIVKDVHKVSSKGMIDFTKDFAFLHLK
jgi:hypothetical protein